MRDVKRLALCKVERWVPMRPGVLITSLSREGDEVRAFSPGAPWRHGPGPLAERSSGTLE